MAFGTQRVIDNRFISDGEVKKYRSTQEQIDQNQREKETQRMRDERARNEASNRNGNIPSPPPG